jgi:hypothetical protein
MALQLVEPALPVGILHELNTKIMINYLANLLKHLPEIWAYMVINASHVI